MPHPVRFDDADPVLGRVRAIALELPDTAEKVSHGIPAFFTTKVFAYYGGSEKQPDGSYERHTASITVLLEAGDREALLQEGRAYVPMYLGPSGWIGVPLRLDADWDEVGELVESSYRLTAGVRRVRRLDERRGER